MPSTFSMMRLAYPLILLAILSLIPVNAIQAQRIDSLAIVSHARFLASDALQGRANGSPGQAAAAEYIAAQFHRLGLQAADGQRTYRQRIPLQRVRIDRDAARLVVARGATRDTVPGTLFYHAGGDSLSFLSFDGPVLAVDDLRRVAGFRGKVIVANAIPAGEADSIVGELERGGARGLILVIGDSTRFGLFREARGADRFTVRAPIGARADRQLPVIIAHPRARPALLAADSLRAVVNPKFESVEAANVFAIKPGTDTILRDRYVVVVAHYDHIGVGPAVAGDSIYNGFTDNAAGVAAMLSIAEEVAARPLRQSVLFLAVPVEEEGSYGSAYFVARPPVPLSSVTAAINLDAPPPLAPPRGWFAEGGDHPAFATALRRVSAATSIEFEPAPMQSSSDHWSFHVRGIPALFLFPKEGWQGMTPAEETAAVDRWWRGHRPDDEWDASFPVRGLVAYAQVALDIVFALAR